MTHHFRRLTCKNGHALIDENVRTYVDKRSGRVQRKCLKCEPRKIDRAKNKRSKWDRVTK